MASELIAPIVEDLRKSDNRMDIIKGIEKLNVKDEPITAAVKAKVPVLEMGDWLIKTGSGLDLPGAGAVANTFPVWVGLDQYDAQATQHATILISGGFIYRTTKFSIAAGALPIGSNLTVKLAGVPELAGVGDPVLARVYTAADAAGVMEIQVLDR